jgi:hypothetical protein
MKYPDRVQGWSWNPRSEVDEFRHIDLKRWPLIINATNLKIIPTACLGIAACYFRGRLPQTEGWLELARSSAKAFATFYGSDGCYDEGVSYWGYTTLYLALFAEVLWRTQGIDDRNLINYPGTVRYALGNTMPTIDDHRKLSDFQHVKGYHDADGEAGIRHRESRRLERRGRRVRRRVGGTHARRCVGAIRRPGGGRGEAALRSHLV